MLIAVLRSSIPLDAPLAMRLYHSAIKLERNQDSVEKLSGDLAMGEVRRLGETIALGAITGPGFEAAVDTPRGSGVVRFVVTRRGLDEADDSPPASLPN